jgi:hypothetical protein
MAHKRDVIIIQNEAENLSDEAYAAMMNSTLISEGLKPCTVEEWKQSRQEVEKHMKELDADQKKCIEAESGDYDLG